MLPALPPDQSADAPSPEVPAGPPEYEFTPAQNATFARAAFWMEWAGRVFVGCGGVGTLLGLVAGLDVLLVVEGVVTVVVGVYTWWVAAAFRRVERTSGQDITHVLSAVRHLGRMYAFQLLFIPVLFTVAVVIALLAGGKNPPVGGP